MKILHVVGARPNFMKLAPVYEAISKISISQYILHTGQHYDTLMSDIFFQQLDLPAPNFNLGIGGGSHTEQTAKAMLGIEKVLLDLQPAYVIVYGDVNSTLAATLVCTKLQIKIAHVEAGLRSYDREMPEEVNRVLTDRIADILFTPSLDGNENLLREGIEASKIHFVGNVMIDTLVKSLEKIKQSPQFVEKAAALIANLPSKLYFLVTLHRPSNVDNLESLKNLITLFSEIAQETPIIFPIHPRTKKQLEQNNLLPSAIKNLYLIEPLGYFDFLYLQKNALGVITDSGGVQEETTYLKVPCLTLRKNTERPITIAEGTNILIGEDYQLLKEQIIVIKEGKFKTGNLPKFWEGKAGTRIAEIMNNLLNC